MTASGRNAKGPFMNAFMSGSLARPVMRTGPSSWTSWHTWAPVLGTLRGNAARPVGCTMRRGPACSKQSGTAMAWWPSAVRLITAGTLRARTRCPARACRRKPMPTAWLMRLTAVSCLQGSRVVMSTAASGLDSVGKCIPIGRSGLPCLTCTLKGLSRPTASTQIRCTCEPHSACLPACLLNRDMTTSGTTDAGEYEMHDLRLQWPFRMLLAGCSWSGKSTLTTWLVALSSRVMIRTPARVLVFYSHMQPAYRELARQAPCPVQLLDRDKHFTEQLIMEPGTLVIVDDMQATHARLVSSWFTRRAHHHDSSIIHLVQNVFDKDPSHRTISLNATYIVLFKNPRDMSQVSHLDKQVSLLASLYNPIVNPEMVSTVRFYDRNELYGSPDGRNCRMPNF